MTTDFPSSEIINKRSVVTDSESVAAREKDSSTADVPKLHENINPKYNSDGVIFHPLFPTLSDSMDKNS